MASDPEVGTTDDDVKEAATMPTNPQQKAVEAKVDNDEQVMLNYQMATFCFASLDVLSTLLNVMAIYAWTPATGFDELFEMLFLVLLLGPACGILGASKLKRSMVTIFMANSLIKALVLLGYAFYSLYFWTVLFAFLQCWITKIVATFWYLLGQIPKARRQQLRAATAAQADPVIEC